MLRAGGAHAGGRVLSAEMVATMTTDRLTAEQRAASTPFLAPQSGWGLGLCAPAADGARGVPGGYGWDGGTGTTWRSDPDLDLTVILFTQRAMTSPEPPALFTECYAAAYAAVQD
jgi:CubicO group peptidase (beta-lactamase class C family)